MEAFEDFDLDSLYLSTGGHTDRDCGVCLLEAIAWFAGEPHSDRPACVCPALGAFGRAWNDGLDDTTRQKLIPYIPRIVGTAGDGAQYRRGWMAFDWLIRVCLPEFLNLAGLSEEAASLRRLPEIHDHQSTERALPILLNAKENLQDRDKVGMFIWGIVKNISDSVGGDAAVSASCYTVDDLHNTITVGDAASIACYNIGHSISTAAVNATLADPVWDAAWRSATGAPELSTVEITWEAAKSKIAPVFARLIPTTFALFERMIEAGKEGV